LSERSGTFIVYSKADADRVNISGAGKVVGTLVWTGPTVQRKAYYQHCSRSITGVGEHPFIRPNCEAESHIYYIMLLVYCIILLDPNCRQGLIAPPQTEDLG
jgi:hypothetical protein